MTILVPTDFSKLSKVAVLYAARIAKKLKGDVILLAVIYMKTSAASSLKWRKLEEEMIKRARQDADQLMDEVRGQIKGKLEITYQYINGHPVFKPSKTDDSN